MKFTAGTPLTIPEAVTRTRPSRSRRGGAVVAVVVALFAMVLVGCSDDGDTVATDGGDPAAEAPVALSGDVNDEGTEDISGQGAQATIEVRANENAFVPTFIKAAPGATVTVELHNEGASAHTFSLDDGSVDEGVQAGESKSFEVTIPESGALRFHCNFHGGGGMQGAFFTKAGDPLAGAGGSPDGGSSTTTTTQPSTGGY